MVYSSGSKTTMATTIWAVEEAKPKYVTSIPNKHKWTFIDPCDY